MTQNQRPQKKGNYRHGKNHHYKNRNQGKPLSPSKIIQKYDNLLEQHLIARKKYFDLFGNPEEKQLPKAYDNFIQTIKDLRNFEDKLIDWQKKALESKTEMYPKDTEYSENHKDEETLQVSFEGEFEPQHYLLSQRESNYKDDKEMTVGTIEDYKAYKGITD